MNPNRKQQNPVAKLSNTTLSNAIITLSQHTGLSKAQLLALLRKPIAAKKKLYQEQQKKRADKKVAPKAKIGSVMLKKYITPPVAHRVRFETKKELMGT